MHSVVIRRAALIDLDGIASYTTERWGAQQSRKYLDTVRKDIESLAEFPLRNPVHEGEQANVHKMASGHHIVFYRVTADWVEIARVLHERMDFDEALG